MEDKRTEESKRKNETADMDRSKIEEAHIQADQDMEDDAEFTATSPNDDLDEEESARQGEEMPL